MQKLTIIALALGLGASSLTFAQDSDGDGSHDTVEANAQRDDGSFGDINADGIADASQASVVSGLLANGVRGRENIFTGLALASASQQEFDSFRFEGTGSAAALDSSLRGRANVYTGLASSTFARRPGFDDFRFEGAAAVSEADVQLLTGEAIDLPYGVIVVSLVNAESLVPQHQGADDGVAEIRMRIAFEDFSGGGWSWYDASGPLDVQNAAEVLSARPVGDSWVLRIRVGTGSGRTLNLIGGPTRASTP